MMTDHNSSDLAPHDKRCPVENVSSGLAEKTRFVTPRVGILFSPLLEYITIQPNDHAGENNNDQARMHSFQEAQICQSFLYKRYKKLEEGIDFERIICSGCWLGSSSDFVAHAAHKSFPIYQLGRENGIFFNGPLRGAISDDDHAGCLDLIGKALLEDTSFLGDKLDRFKYLVRKDWYEMFTPVETGSSDK
ncbi:hypothetical protein Tco_0458514 [Tanacetum coccineum]